MDGQSMGENSIKNSRIKIPRSNAHLQIIGRMSKKFQVNLMKDVGGVAETRSWAAGQMDRRMDGITHTQMDKDYFYSPHLPLSGGGAKI